jgi:hypothetical protein
LGPDATARCSIWNAVCDWEGPPTFHAPIAFTLDAIVCVKCDALEVEGESRDLCLKG